MIELVNFTKKYKDVTACKNINFSCEDCKITGLLGPNGAGKTTVIKGICAIHYPTSGKILVDGISVEEEPVKAQKLIGYVSETSEYPVYLKVSEILRDVAELRLLQNGEILNKKIVNQRIEKVVSLMELEEVFLKNVTTLSKGFKQRLSFALALIHDPKILILDEPVSGLDPMQIVEMRSLIRKLGKEKTVLLSTHLMQEAKELCDEIVILHKGNLIANGTVKEICKKTNTQDLEKAFLVLAQDTKLKKG